MTDARNALVQTLRRDWPDRWIQKLSGEVEAFLAGSPASLPIMRQSTVFWATTAPDERALRFATEDVRAWLVPNFAVEDGLRTFGSAAGELGEQLLAFSPAGYMAWRCRTDQAESVFSKLKTLRTLLERRPKQERGLPRSLLEMRRRFQTALIGGDRAAAQEVVDGLELVGSETASNVLFMRVKMWEVFREHGEILEPERVRRLSRIPLPREIRAAIVSAYFWKILASHADMQRRSRIYAEQGYPLIGSIVAQCQPEDSVEVLECMAYHAVTLRDAALARELFGLTSEPLLQGLLSAVADAEIPAVGAVPETPHQPRADAGLAGAASWDDLCDALSRRDWARAESFLESEERPSLAIARASTCRRVLDSLLEILTSPAVEGDAEDVARDATLAAIDDVRFDIGFPRSDMAPLYRSFLGLWQEMHAGSANSEDRAVFLLLLDASLQVDSGAMSDALDAIQNWWGRRTCRSSDVFLIECLATMSEYIDDLTSLHGLWYAGLQRARLRGPLRGPDRRHWRSLADGLGIDLADVSGLAAEPVGSIDEEDDPLASCTFKRIAIVSGKEAPARIAAGQIEARSGAKTFVVSSSVAGEATDRARQADCILLVWAAISHAAFRAFDGVRDKLVYVQGTGASSIVMALERTLE